MAKFKNISMPRGVGRIALIALMVVATLYVIRFFRERAFLAATGFLPLDLQFPLRPHAIAIQLGAYPAGADVSYAAFALVDTLLAATNAAAILVLWMWIFRTQQNRVFVFLQRGGILMLPLAAGALDVAENVGFYRLVHGLTGQAYADTIEITATIHSVESALIYIRDAMTFLLIAAALRGVWRRRMAKASA